MSQTSVTSAQNGAVIAKAAREFRTHLSGKIENPMLEDVRILGDFSDFPQGSIKDPELDDAFVATYDAGTLKLAVTNPRAALIGVFRVLDRLGFRWLRPGLGGSIWLGDFDTLKSSFKITEAAVHRHRGICIEGAASVEHLADIIDWMPKMGLNSYFIQFREPREFLQRWYRHPNNPLFSPVDFPEDDFPRMTKEIVRKVKENGLLLHGVGHGWTCAAIGLEAHGWDRVDEGSSGTKMQLLAEINGKRAFFKGIPMNTNLCYGNPEVQKLLIDEVVAYALGHPEIDYLHFWLADEINNQCECVVCKDTLPSDFYVLMLNEIDCRLTALNLPTRIVFLCYLDLLWAPEQGSLRNPDRFVIMLAPITRSFAEPLGCRTCDIANIDMPPYIRNHVEAPKSPEINLAFLNRWKSSSPGLDSFVFDYHFMWAHYFDMGRMDIASILRRDVDGYMECGLNGLMSCQVQRAFSPTSLAMRSMACLWQSTGSDASTTSSLLEDEFGPAWREANAILSALSVSVPPSMLRGEVCAEKTPMLDGLQNVLDQFPVWHDQSARRSKEFSGAWQISWELLADWLVAIRPLLYAYSRLYQSDNEAAAVWFREFQTQGQQLEFKYPMFFDWHQCFITIRDKHFIQQG
jgi:hypothetical protein